MSWKEELYKLLKNNWNQNETFNLDELYKFEDHFQNEFPNNNHVRDKIRQTLQKLRDDNKIEFLSDRGEYKIINSDESSNNQEQNQQNSFRNYLAKILSGIKKQD